MNRLPNSLFGPSAVPPGVFSRRVYFNVNGTQSWVLTPRGGRSTGTEAGENESGHISAGPSEGILFFEMIVVRIPASCESVAGIVT